MKNKYIIVGPGASGKDWLLNRMMSLGFRPMRQYTTREKRENETGNEYHFVDEETFKKMESENKFASVNFYHIGWYGVSYDELRKSDVAILSPANVRDVFRMYPGLRDRYTIIYLDMPIELRRKRLAARYVNKVGDDNERRLAADEHDFAGYDIWDLRFEDVKSVNDFINNLSLSLKG